MSVLITYKTDVILDNIEHLRWRLRKLEADLEIELDLEIALELALEKELELEVDLDLGIESNSNAVTIVGEIEKVQESIVHFLKLYDFMMAQAAEVTYPYQGANDES